MVSEGGLDWSAIERSGWWQAMAQCPQDPIHHAEGDVATHTTMVVNALEASEGFETLSDEDQVILRLAALLHDCGKPATTRTEPDGRITSHGHARVGAILARRLLWESGFPVALREAVCALVRWHMRPGYLLESDDPMRVALTIAQTARCDHLALLADADARGRIAPNTDEACLKVALFAEFCREAGCLATPYPFASDHSRFLYFRTPGRAPDYAAWDDTRGEMILLAGLPGSGKSTYQAQRLADLPSVSLDDMRRQLGIAPSDPQEPVVLAALERSRSYVRAGESFVWNATNLRHELRARPIGLAADYRFRVRIIVLEAPATRLFRQNRERAAAVPEAVMGRYLDRWEMPTLLEAHAVDLVES